MKTEVVNITPKMASELLKNNSRNRPINKQIVNHLMSLIKNDQWKLTHQGIAISITNCLLDGQHRLTAISKGNKTVPMLVVKGLPDSVMTVIDTGKKRNVSDALKLLEVSNYTHVASGIGTYESLILDRQNLISTDANKGIAATSTDEKYQFYLDNQTVFDKTIALAQKCYQTIRLFTPSLIIGISLFLIIKKKHSFSLVSEFWLQVHNISDNGQSNGTKLLHNALIKYLSGNEKIKANVKLAITTKAWNLYKTGGQAKILKFTETDAFPKFE